MSVHYNNAQTFAGHAMRFGDIKSETLNLRVSPSFKRALKEAANAEQRSMVNMLEVLLGDYCDCKGITFRHIKNSSPLIKKTKEHTQNPIFTQQVQEEGSMSVKGTKRK